MHTFITAEWKERFLMDELSQPPISVLLTEQENHTDHTVSSERRHVIIIYALLFGVLSHSIKSLDFKQLDISYRQWSKSYKGPLLSVSFLGFGCRLRWACFIFAKKKKKNPRSKFGRRIWQVCVNPREEWSGQQSCGQFSDRAGHSSRVSTSNHGRHLNRGHFVLLFHHNSCTRNI